MRILIHDFAGHPFQVQLSRELASLGHDVTHAYPVGLDGPKGRLESSDADSSRLTIKGIPLSSGFRKYSACRRFATQRQYAGDLRRLVSRNRFDVVLSGNTPIDVQAELLWHCHRNGVGFVHWVQDIYHHAIEFFLRRKVGSVAKPLSFPFLKLEQLVASWSDGVITIAPAFRQYLLNWGVEPAKITVLENWAPLDEMDSLPRDNAWSERNGLTGQTVFLYSGTLGLKHRPDLIYALAQSLGDSCKVVVITEGVGREYLQKQPKLNNLVLLGFQPYHEVPQVLASADVLLATLEADAGEFAVPSKVLSYLCAGRALLLAAPSSNLAASVVQRSGAGIVADPNKTEEWIEAAKSLATNSATRLAMGVRARHYAEANFDISRIATAFEGVLATASAKGLPTSEVAPAIQTEA
jgi:colanic acid biosynthesis glycosyl transferase WcaI